MTKRPEKKSETIEVRVSYSEKLAFMDACKKAGTTASHAIRDYMNDFLSPEGVRTTKKRHLTLTIGALSFVAIITALVLSVPTAQQPTTSEQVLAYFDRNHDGYISAVDIENADAGDQKSIQSLLDIMDDNLDGRVDTNEMEALANITIELRSAQREKVNGGGHRRVLIIPDNLSEAERQQYLARIESNSSLSADEQQRLRRIIDALTQERADEQNTKP